MSISEETGENSKTLLLAVVQAQDVESAQNSLSKLGLTSTRLPSVGGFLGRRNVTLMIGLGGNKKQAAIDALHASCRQRIEYIAVPLESAPLPLPTPTAITIGGATIFSLDIDHFEEF
jgi:uncharacterized protein YaaQ